MTKPIVLDGDATPAKDRTGRAYDDGKLRITAIEVDHAPIEPAYAYRFDYGGRAVFVTGELKYHPPLVAAAAGADLLVSEAISRPMTKALEDGARSARRTRQAAIRHDVQDYHVSPEEAAGRSRRRYAGGRTSRARLFFNRVLKSQERVYKGPPALTSLPGLATDARSMRARVARCLH